MVPIGFAALNPILRGEQRAPVQRAWTSAFRGPALLRALGPTKSHPLERLGGVLATSSPERIDDPHALHFPSVAQILGVKLAATQSSAPISTARVMSCTGKRNHASTKPGRSLMR
jgi:hypothetical protein